MPVVALIFVASFGGGVLSCWQWLPRLAPGRVGGLAFAAVCLLGAVAVAIVAMDVYELVDNISRAASDPGLGAERRDILASGLAGLLRDAGPVIGLAAAVYLLAPGLDDADEPLHADAVT